MTYQVLARKYRPHDFDSMVGQDHVVAALRHALDEDRLHHAYLFTGTRGVGKTTLSRILAKCLNCTGEDGRGGVTSRPCGKCPACRAIDEGRFIDYIEIDAASNRSVEEMTAVLERAMYAPTDARYKVYMIDEVHMLTQHAFNAMLKTLEEPPPYVKFILATTDPQKVPVTVLSRCLQFNLRNMPPADVARHMAELMKAEGIAAEPAALRLLAAGARGSMRDGLSLLDQAIAFCAGPVTLEGVRAMLGVMDSDALVALTGCVLAGDARGALAIADDMGARSLSYAQAVRDWAALLHRVALAQRVPEMLDAGDQQVGREFPVFLHPQTHEEY
ncbi:MAG: DNA polymerase III subunit gamma/tau, partial [Duodenibacillus sp.]|nr:DNA polymerase III subunit gamma/tau [Duodenibacillus sp.]